MPRFVPTRPGHTLYPRDVAFLEGVDHSALKKIRDRQTGTGPSGLDLTHPVSRALYPWQAGVDISQAVARVQVPPMHFLRMVLRRAPPWRIRGNSIIFFALHLFIIK